jgi:dTDP-4-amino-4,6-dideoxygalactose transaminase
LESKTKGILSVHLYGQITDGQEIRSFSDEYGLLMVEDAAQAHGAKEGLKKQEQLVTLLVLVFTQGKI